MFLIGTLFAPLCGVIGVTLFSCLEIWSVAIPGGEVRAAYCAAAGFLLAAGWRWWKRSSQLPAQPAIPIAIWLGAALFSSLLSPHPLEAIAALMKWALLAGTCLAIADTLRVSAKPQATIPLLWAGCMGITIVVGGAQILFSPSATTIHLSAGFLDWNYTAMALAMMLPLIWHSHLQEQRPPLKLCWQGLFAAGLAMALATRSRSGLLALMATLAALFVFRQLDRKYAYVAFAFVLAGLAYVLGIAGTGIFSPSRILDDPHVQERLTSNMLAFHVLLENPLSGVGAGQFESYASSLNQESGFGVSGSHSAWLVLLVETGMIGGLAFLWLLTSLALNSWRIRHIQEGFPLFITALATLTAATLYSIHAHLFTWCLIGFLASRQDSAED